MIFAPLAAHSYGETHDRALLVTEPQSGRVDKSPLSSGDCRTSSDAGDAEGGLVRLIAPDTPQHQGYRNQKDTKSCHVMVPAQTKKYRHTSPPTGRSGLPASHSAVPHSLCVANPPSPGATPASTCRSEIPEGPARQYGSHALTSRQDSPVLFPRNSGRANSCKSLPFLIPQCLTLTPPAPQHEQTYTGHNGCQ